MSLLNYSLDCVSQGQVFQSHAIWLPRFKSYASSSKNDDPVYWNFILHSQFQASLNSFPPQVLSYSKTRYFDDRIFFIRHSWVAFSSTTQPLYPFALLTFISYMCIHQGPFFSFDLSRFSIRMYSQSIWDPSFGGGQSSFRLKNPIPYWIHGHELMEHSWQPLDHSPYNNLFW